MILAAILDTIFVFTCHMTCLTAIHHTCAYVLYLRYCDNRQRSRRGEVREHRYVPFPIFYLMSKYGVPAQSAKATTPAPHWQRAAAANHHADGKGTKGRVSHTGESVMVDVVIRERKKIANILCMTYFGRTTPLCAEPLDCPRTRFVPDPCLSDDPLACRLPPSGPRPLFWITDWLWWLTRTVTRFSPLPVNKSLVCINFSVDSDFVYIYGKRHIPVLPHF